MKAPLPEWRQMILYEETEVAAVLFPSGVPKIVRAYALTSATRAFRSLADLPPHEARKILDEVRIDTLQRKGLS